MTILLFLIMMPILFLTPESQALLSDINLADYRWKNRIVLVFSDSPDNIMYQDQIETLSNNKSGLSERDVIVISLLTNGESHIDRNSVSIDSAQRIKERYNPEKNDFRFILIGKDGGVKMNTDNHVTIHTFFGRIDSMPMRIREMRILYRCS